MRLELCPLHAAFVSSCVEMIRFSLSEALIFGVLTWSGNREKKLHALAIRESDVQHLKGSAWV